MSRKVTLTKEKEKIKILPDDTALLEKYIEEISVFFPLPLCYVNPIGVVLEFNPAFEEISGYKTGEIISESIDKLFIGEESRLLREETLRKGFVEGKEMAILTKKGKKIPVSVFSRARKDEGGKIVGYFASLFELTEIKKIRKALEKEMEELTEKAKELENTKLALMNILEDVAEAREEALRERDKTSLVINNLVDGLLVFDSRKNLSLLNPSAEKFFDLKERDVSGRAFPELSTFPTLNPLINFLEKAGSSPVFRKELPFHQELILEVSIIPLIRREEKELLVILHDVSREKKIERMKSEFVSLAAHQLRTPLSAIKWTMKMFLEGDLGSLSGEQRSYMEKIYKSNERMINLINDLLNITRIEEGRYLYKSALVQLEEIAQPVFDSFKEPARRKGIELEFLKPAKKTPKILVDKEKIGLAIQNLIDNAMRYSLSGGKVTVSLKCDKKEVELSVRDAGFGIPKDQQNRIFTKFFRGANVIQRETEGSGLGLFITKNIIETHGGRIWFESEEKKGTTFHLALPIKEEFATFLKEF